MLSDDFDDFDLPQESLDKFLPLFAKNRAEDLERIQQSVKTSNFEEISGLAHRIKGTAAAFGHPLFGDLAKELEQHALASSIELCQTLAADLQTYFVTHIAGYLERGTST